MDAGGNQLNIYEKNLNKNEWKGFSENLQCRTMKDKTVVTWVNPK